MKIQFDIQDGRADVRIRGEVLGGSCDCLQHFWDRHLDDETSVLRVDLRDVTRLDDAGRNQILQLLQRQAASGTQITLLTEAADLRSAFNRVVGLPGRAITGD